MGDSTDDVPGVPGIGEKTAKDLMAQYGTLEISMRISKQLKAGFNRNSLSTRNQLLCPGNCSFSRLMQIAVFIGKQSEFSHVNMRC